MTLAEWWAGVVALLVLAMVVGMVAILLGMMLVSAVRSLPWFPDPPVPRILDPWDGNGKGPAK